MTRIVRWLAEEARLLGWDVPDEDSDEERAA
jgi:hypothetical protein